MPKTVPVTIEVAGLPAVRDAITAAVAAERERFTVLVGATCACGSCKDGVAKALAGDLAAAGLDERPAT